MPVSRTWKLQQSYAGMQICEDLSTIVIMPYCIVDKKRGDMCETLLMQIYFVTQLDSCKLFSYLGNSLVVLPESVLILAP